jgi:hypothetical protein
MIALTISHTPAPGLLPGLLHRQALAGHHNLALSTPPQVQVWLTPPSLVAFQHPDHALRGAL